MTGRLRKALSLLSVATLIAVCSAQTVERVGAPDSDALADATKQALESQGYRVRLENGRVDFWFAKNLVTTKKDAPGALYPALSDGEFVGIVSFAQAFTDFRGQNVPTGFYTLRYQLLPQDGNHLGVAPNPDFLLAIPAASDTNPEQIYPFKKLVTLSAKSTGGSHPAVFALGPAGEAGTVTKSDSGILLSVAMPTAAGTQKIAICLTCTASQ